MDMSSWYDVICVKLPWQRVQMLDLAPGEALSSTSGSNVLPYLEMARRAEWCELEEGAGCKSATAEHRWTYINGSHMLLLLAQV